MMKKSFFLLLFFVFQAIPCFAQENYDVALDMPSFAEMREFARDRAMGVKKFGAKSKKKFTEVKKDVSDKVLKATGKPTDQSLSNMTKKEKEEALLNSQSNGYYGTLPNIEREFNYLRQGDSKTNLKGNFKDTLIDEMKLKKAPVTDDLYLDVILQKQGDPQYIKDVLKISQALQRFRTCIYERCDIQRFNGNVNLIDLYAKRLEKDYANTPESNSNSYYLIRNIAYLAKLQGNLKYDANFYSKYMPLQGTVYAKENIEKKDMELMHELDKTIFELQQLK